ncbi:MAG TPA: MlaE family lipid ABC transporter permease subunit [Hyphomonas sp.]|nr:MlaE family lipid ABC transporter permease subunit [Hyphomonas sp.]MCB9960890.1 MlaE family lipid ABC transporter permease subunit [Hyphomonas sp.]MCB9970181.1 MlaE family lipid ABC transporter permease subunit [Hyphomonas sp.]HPE49123.1 MlaE family lipid ABC transporter permease subunit [Hyphomonas sp.]
MPDMKVPGFALEEGGEVIHLRLSGDWTVATIHLVDESLRDLDAGRPLRIDITGIGRIDTAGAFMIDRTLRAAPEGSAIEGTHAVAQHLLPQVHEVSEPVPPAPRPEHGFVALLDRTGRGFMDILSEVLATLAFLGETLVTTIRLLMNPFRMRWTSVVSVMEEAGLDAMPIIAFLSFFVGLVVAYIGATTLRDFDLQIYTVELIGYSMLREFGVVLTGIVLAGRTNSSFTAQIGTMKMRQEIDAMKTLGLKPMDVLVAPRIIAMVLMTPALAFVSTAAGIAGGIIVGWTSLDINPGVFIDRLQNNVPVDQFWVGMSKAPVFGFVVSLIACRQGLNVGGSVQSLGRSTTTSVVQALFAIIVLDAMFAIFYMEMGI